MIFCLLENLMKLCLLLDFLILLLLIFLKGSLGFRVVIMSLLMVVLLVVLWLSKYCWLCFDLFIIYIVKGFGSWLIIVGIFCSFLKVRIGKIGLNIFFCIIVMFVVIWLSKVGGRNLLVVFVFLVLCVMVFVVIVLESSLLILVKFFLLMIWV